MPYRTSQEVLKQILWPFDGQFNKEMMGWSRLRLDVGGATEKKFSSWHKYRRVWIHLGYSY
jgi:hypothetical protein